LHDDLNVRTGPEAGVDLAIPCIIIYSANATEFEKLARRVERAMRSRAVPDMLAIRIFEIHLAVVWLLLQAPALVVDEGDQARAQTLGVPTNTVGVRQGPYPRDAFLQPVSSYSLENIRLVASATRNPLL